MDVDTQPGSCGHPMLSHGLEDCGVYAQQALAVCDQPRLATLWAPADHL